MASGARIAIACQGGGSHTAFTAGALSRLLRHYDRAELRLEGTPGRILALSGSSSGAMCALLAWYGLLTDQSGGRSPAELLDDFWTGNTASEWWHILLNAAVVQTSRLEGYVALPEISPYIFERLRTLTQSPVREWLDTAGRLRRLLEQHVDFAAIPELVKSDLVSPRLLVRFILRLNALKHRLRHEHNVELHPDFKEVRIARITISLELSSRLQAASKLDRNPELIGGFVKDGERQADAFLHRRAEGTVDWAM